MSKKTLMAVAIVVVFLVGGYFLLDGKNKVAEAPVQNESDAAPAGKKIAFSELAKQGGSYKCEVKQYLSDMENEGTVYMSGKNIRGEFSTVAEGKKVDSYFVMKDGYMYNWSSMVPMGIKLKATAEAQAEAQTQGTYAWNTDMVGDYDCQAWVADDSKFELPSSVTFTEIKSQ